jgi:type VI secretion system secreted protein Hcp
MAVDTFLQFPAKSIGGSSIQLLGESLDPKFKDALEINSFSFGMENPTTIGSATGGATVGKVKFNEFTIKKVVDRASPSLFQACCTGSHFPEAVLSIRRSSVAAPGETYLIYNFAMVFCTKVEWADNEVPEESVTFAYGNLKITYMQQNATTGRLGDPFTAAWSQITNKSEYVPQ